MRHSQHKSLLATIFTLLLALGFAVFLWQRSDIEQEPIAESWGTIIGTVVLGPTCPVVMDPPDPSCADRPYETRLAITTADQSKVIKEVASDAEGKFRIDLPAGAYAIRSAAAANILPYCSADNVVVPVNETVEIIVNCDTGIR